MGVCGAPTLFHSSRSAALLRRLVFPAHAVSGVGVADSYMLIYLVDDPRVRFRVLLPKKRQEEDVTGDTNRTAPGGERQVLAPLLLLTSKRKGRQVEA